MKEPRWSDSQIEQFCCDVFDYLMQTLQQEKQVQTLQENYADEFNCENEKGDLR